MLWKKLIILAAWLFLAAFSSHEVSNNLNELFFDRLVREVGDVSLGDEDDIDRFSEDVGMSPKHFADPPLDPITLDRIPNLT